MMPLRHVQKKHQRLLGIDFGQTGCLQLYAFSALVLASLIFLLVGNRGCDIDCRLD